MTERVDVHLSVAPDHAAALAAALATAGVHAEAHAATQPALVLQVTATGPGEARLVLEAADEAALAQAVKAIGPAFEPLDGKVRLHDMSFTPGIGPAIRTRLGAVAPRFRAR